MKKEHKEQFKKEIGWTPPGVMVAETFGEEFAERIANYHHDIWSEEGALDLKTRYLIALATAIVLNNETRAKLELKKAIKWGATKEELLEVLKQQVWMMGAPMLVQLAPIVKMINDHFHEKN